MNSFGGQIHWIECRLLLALAFCVSGLSMNRAKAAPPAPGGGAIELILSNPTRDLNRELNGVRGRTDSGSVLLSAELPLTVIDRASYLFGYPVSQLVFSLAGFARPAFVRRPPWVFMSPHFNSYCPISGHHSTCLLYHCIDHWRRSTSHCKQGPYEPIKSSKVDSFENNYIEQSVLRKTGVYVCAHRGACVRRAGV